MKCGYDLLPILEFHHVTKEANRERYKWFGKTKEFRNWKRYKTVPKNIQLLCPTCHRETHLLLVDAQMF